MAARLIWSQAALDDIDAIADYISQDSTYHAQRVVEGFFALGDLIAEHPQLGRTVPELGRDHVRERFLYSYRIVYEIQNEQVHILAVIHGKRLLEAIEDRLE